MVVSIKTTFVLLLFSALNLNAAINPHAISVNNAQMVNLNLKIKSSGHTLKSNLLMPFYQTAEFERKFGDKNILVEVSPKRGKNDDEIALVMKFYKASGTKAFYKKEIMAKVNEESTVSFRGMSMRITPSIN